MAVCSWPGQVSRPATPQGLLWVLSPSECCRPSLSLEEQLGWQQDTVLGGAAGTGCRAGTGPLGPLGSPGSQRIRPTILHVYIFLPPSLLLPSTELRRAPSQCNQPPVEASQGPLPSSPVPSHPVLSPATSGPAKILPKHTGPGFGRPCAGRPSPEVGGLGAGAGFCPNYAVPPSPEQDPQHSCSWVCAAGEETVGAAGEPGWWGAGSDQGVPRPPMTPISLPSCVPSLYLSVPPESAVLPSVWGSQGRERCVPKAAHPLANTNPKVSQPARLLLPQLPPREGV